MDGIFCRKRWRSIGRIGSPRASSAAKLESYIRSAVQDTEAIFSQRDAYLDFLRHHGGVDLDVLRATSASNASGAARAFSHRQSIWPFWHYDQRPIRDRVPGFDGWKDLGAISFP